MLTLNLSRVKERDSDLYYKLMDVYLIRETDGVEVLSVPDYKVNWLTPHYRERALKLEEDLKAEADAEQQRKVDAEAAEKQQKIASDTEAYKNRLLQYVNEQGLEPTIQNAEAIKQWIKTNTSDYKSSNNVDAAVKLLGPRGSNVLTWKAKEAPAPPPPAPEPVVKLKDGSDQLPIDAQPTFQHTKLQLADLAKRQAAAKTVRRDWHGVKM
jgi:hypothetical protein